MARLHFPNKGLLSVVRYTRQATAFSRSLGGAIEAYEKAEGKTFSFEDKIDDKYYTTDKPLLLLVKDRGVYIMTAAKMPLPEDESHVCYATGYNPAKDDDWYEKAWDAVGGDDFGEEIEASELLLRAIENDGVDIVIDITEHEFSVKTFN